MASHLGVFLKILDDFGLFLGRKQNQIKSTKWLLTYSVLDFVIFKGEFKDQNYLPPFGFLIFLLFSWAENFQILRKNQKWPLTNWVFTGGGGGGGGYTPPVHQILNLL